MWKVWEEHGCPDRTGSWLEAEACRQRVGMDCAVNWEGSERARRGVLRALREWEVDGTQMGVDQLKRVKSRWKEAATSKNSGCGAGRMQP